MSKLSNGILENLQKWSKKSPVSPFFPWNFPWEIPPQHQVVVVFGVTSSWWLGQAPSKLCEDSSVDERRALGDRFGWDLPSGSLTQLQKITMLLMGKSTISMAIVNSFLYVYQRVSLLSTGLYKKRLLWVFHLFTIPRSGLKDTLRGNAYNLNDGFTGWWFGT